MKRILFLLLLTVSVYGQNPSRFAKIQITGNSNSGTATKVNVQEANGEVNTQTINTGFNKNIGLGGSDVVGANTLLNQYATTPSDWTAQSYVLNSVVFYGGKQWIAKIATVAGDVPAVSSKWEEITFEALSNKTVIVASFSALSTLVTGSEIVYVDDLYRGGLFRKYTGADIVDDGVIFLGVSGSKWQRVNIAPTPLLQWWGVDGTGVTDNTVNVNRALTFCGTYGYKYLNVTGTIKITGRLNDYKNKVLFVGSGIFNNTYKQNYGEADVSNSEVSFSGKINKEGDLNKTLQIIKANTGLKIVVFGNSIAYGRDYNTQTPAGSFHEIVNNETNENSWYGNFCRQLQNKFSDKNITSINRAIPGYAISDYLDVISSEPVPQQPSWLDGTMTGKTWAEIMEDDAPDVIIIEHGMNSGSEYIDYAKAFVDLTKTWTKVPELVFMSTPTLNYIDALGTDWGGTPRLTKLDVQNQQANLSNYYNSYLIDVAKIANIKRYGSDYRNFTFKPRTIESFSFLNGASDLGGGVLGIPANGVVTLNRVSQAPKFYLNLSIKPSSSFTSIRIYTGSAFLIFSPIGVTVYPCTTSGNILPPVSQTYALPIGVSTNIKVEFGDFLNLYIGNELIVSSKVSAPVVNILDDIKIDISGTTGVSEISDLSYYEAEFTKYKPTLTGTELWGELGFGNDGNAINHPSLTGVAETYNQAVNEFVNYLYENSKTVSSIQSIVGTANQVIVTPVGGAITLSLPQSISATSAPTFGGLTIPYAIFANGTRSYSIENIGSSVALTDVTGGAVRWIVNSSGVMDFQQIPTAPTAPAGTNTTQIATTAFVQANTRPYKVYTALLTQISTSNPVATVIENTLGGTVVWSRTGTGIYTATLNGAFLPSKTTVMPFFGTINGGVSLNQTISGVRIDNNSIGIRTSAGGSLTDVLLLDATIEIRVYL